MNYNKVEEILNKIKKVHYGNMYPGYPFAMLGYFFTKTQSGEIEGKKFSSLDQFRVGFELPLFYQGIGSYKATKGSWLVDTKMEDYTKFLEAEEEDFYFDNLNAIKLYFAFYSAYRQYKDKEAIIFFVINDECEWVELKVFQNEQELEEYQKEYWYETQED